jgi:hypothetical protein
MLCNPPYQGRLAGTEACWQSIGGIKMNVNEEQNDETIDLEEIENWRIYREAVRQGKVEAPTSEEMK